MAEGVSHGGTTYIQTIGDEFVNGFLTEEEMMRGDTRVSSECHASWLTDEVHLGYFIDEHFDVFLKMLAGRELKLEYRDAIISYYVLGKAQGAIAHSLGLQQQSSLRAIIGAGLKQLAGKKANKSHAHNPPVVVRSDPDYVAQFRIRCEDVSDWNQLFADRSQVRRYGDLAAQDISYGPPRAGAASAG